MQPKELDLSNYLVRLRQADPEVTAEVNDVLRKRKRPAWSKDAASAMRSLMRVGAAPDDESLNAGNGFEPLELETIVLRYGRPVIAIKKDAAAFDPKDVDSETWRTRLEASAAGLGKVIPSVGRIEVTNHPSGFPYMGTGWVVDTGVIATNRHVALSFAERGSQGFTFSIGFDRKNLIGVSVDFLEEIDNAEKRVFGISKVLFISKDTEPDIAFLAITPDTKGIPSPLRLLRDTVPEKTMVALIGYPARDSRIPEQALMDRIFGNVYDKKRLAPGFVNGLSGGNLLHDCTTLGGNSGSPLVDLATGSVCGLHFSGSFLKSNFAVPSSIVDDYRNRVARGETVDYVPDTQSQEPPKVMELLLPLNASQELKLTIPIEVTLRLGQVSLGGVVVAGSSPGAMTLLPTASPPGPPIGPQPSPSESVVQQAVVAAQQMLANRPDVLKVEAGWKFRDGWITDERAVVISVRQRLAEGALASMGTVPLPKQVMGVPVDVGTAGLLDSDLQVTFPEAISATWTSPYEIWPARPLDSVEAKMKATFHASPDAGWPLLKAFLGATSKSQTVGMYDFTAQHIVDAVRNATKKAGRALSLVLQRGEDIGKGVKKDDIPDAQTVEELQAALKRRMSFAWASVHGADALFRSAYHIKVAVRDSSAFWLSSGNWQSSNQPPHDPLAGDDTTPPLLTTCNRDWHAIIENKALATLYEDYLKRDREQAAARGGEEAVADAVPMVWVPVAYFQPSDVEQEAPVRYFKPLVVNKVLKVQPLLTPDNYSPFVVDLIRSAKTTLSFQNQSLNVRPKGENPEHYENLLTALLEQQQAGVDVRIIIRRIGDLRKTISAIKDYGFDMSKIRLQTNCHTKGIVVDKATVLLGSQNWTGDGTGYNRDASLIVFDEQVAGYYADLFEYDYGRIGSPKIDETLPSPILATGQEGVAPPRMVLMPLERWLGES